MTLLAPLFLILVAPTADAPAPPRATNAARAAALCLAQALPGGAQVHAARNGSYRFTHFAPRRAPARWTVTASSAGVTVTPHGVPAGSKRALRGRCY